MKEVKITGIGSYVPDKVLSNKYLETIVDTTDEWIKERTGIEERRICVNEDTSDLAINAAIEALKSGKVLAQNVELIVVSTVTPDGAVPSVACRVQKAIGAVNAMAFDINAACSGFMFAFDIANNYIKAGTVKNALVVSAEGLSKITNWQDRNTCVLFGDGAGAVFLEESEEKYISHINCKSVGSKGEYIECNNSPMENLFVESKKGEKVIMNGKEVYKFAIKVMEDEFSRILKEAKLSKDDIDYIVPHQANLRMIESFSKKAELPLSKFIINVQKRGNTSGASIPIALDEAFKEGKITKGQNIILVAFGGGLTYGSALVRWSL